MKDENNVKFAKELYDNIKNANIKVDIDLSDKTPGFKFAECEMKGIPIRLEIGPKDIENGKCVLVRRDTSEKVEVDIINIVDEINKLLDDHYNGKKDNYKKVWTIYTFIVWYNQFFEA